MGTSSIWSEQWIAPELRLENLEHQLSEMNSHVYRGGDFDRWDLWIKGGGFGGVRILMASEDHAKGHQYVRFKILPVISSLSRYLLFFAVLLTLLAFMDQSYTAMYIFLALMGLVTFRMILDIGTASGCCHKAFKLQEK